MAPLPAMLIGAVAALALASSPARADEGGVSFWLPGQFGSLAAVPGSPGWSVGTVFFHLNADASQSKEFVLGGRVVGGLDADANLVFVAPTYTFETPVLGGQAAFALVGAYGRMSTAVDVTLTGPRGNAISFGASDATTGGGDLYPLATLKWNHGVHNAMVYSMADIPVGAYQKGRLANIGIGHAAIDAGGGYTYFNTTNGREFSAVAGLTYNFENDDTQYQNGIDSHLDMGASQFLSESMHIGLVGYAYYQLTGDSGAGAVLGDSKSRVFGIGPQVGHFFAVGKAKGYVNLKGYYEFEARNRAEGWNVWLTLGIPLSGV